MLGWVFLCCMIDFIRGVKCLYYCIWFIKEVKYDIKVWLNFLDEFNGKVFFLDDKWEIFCFMKLFIDVVGFKGYGVIFGNYWFYGVWFELWKFFNIVFLELFFIVIVLYIWGFSMVNRCVVFYIDNVVIVDIINR